LIVRDEIIAALRDFEETPLRQYQLFVQRIKVIGGR
jgi:hypothetical protein